MVGWGGASFGGGEVHFGEEIAVEEVEGRFVGAVIHVLDVGLERPVDGFGAEFDIAVLAEESFGVPGMIGRPFSHWGSEDEGFIAPS